MTFRLLSRVLRSKPQPIVKRRRGSPLGAIELLEDRLTPATHTWTGAGGDGLWSTSGNWSDSAPSMNEDLASLVFDTNSAGFAPTTGFASTNDVSGLTNVSWSIVDSSSAGDFSFTLTNGFSLAA